MIRRLHIVSFAALAALSLAACTAKDVLVTKPVSLGLKIESVSGTKVTFSVSAGKQDAAYIIFTAGENERAFDMPEWDAAKEHISYLESVYEKKGVGGKFTDFACYKGSRTLELNYLSEDTEYKLFLFQIHPKTREILGNVHVERFRTNKVKNMSPLEFNFSYSDNSLKIEPDDGTRTYVWGFEREARIIDDYERNPFYYLYALIDMNEDYGFIEHRVCKGTTYYDMSRERLHEGEPYIVMAIGYEDGEITSEIRYAYFVLRGETLIFEIN